VIDLIKARCISYLYVTETAGPICRATAPVQHVSISEQYKLAAHVGLHPPTETHVLLS